MTSPTTSAAALSLSSLFPPPTATLLLSTPDPSHTLLHDPSLQNSISSLLLQPTSGSGDDNLCRWLYDTFQTNDPHLHLVVLRFLPTLTGIYLTRTATNTAPLPGFEAVLLALYAHQTKTRQGQPQIVNIPATSNHPNIYQEKNHTDQQAKNKAKIDLHLGVLSPAVESHGTVRATKRARIVGVVLELYYSNIGFLPVSSKVELCKFCASWAGKEEKEEEEEEEERPQGGRIPLPWELFQPVIRIVGHCLMGPERSDELRLWASVAIRRLHLRALHDMQIPQAVLATRSLLRLREMVDEEKDLGALQDLRDHDADDTVSTPTALLM